VAALDSIRAQIENFDTSASPIQAMIKSIILSCMADADITLPQVLELMRNDLPASVLYSSSALESVDVGVR
jgi:hypothetical protein